MATIHGKGTAFKLDNGAGTLTDISAYCDSADFSQAADANEDTAFSSDTQPAKGYIEGLKDGSLSASGPWDPILDRHLDSMVGRTGTYEYGPEGGAAGKVKYTGEAVVTEYSVSPPVGDKITWSATLQPTGGITRTTF